MLMKFDTELSNRLSSFFQKVRDTNPAPLNRQAKAELFIKEPKSAKKNAPQFLWLNGTKPQTDASTEDIAAFNRFVYLYDLEKEAKTQYDIRELLRNLYVLTSKTNGTFQPRVNRDQDQNFDIESIQSKAVLPKGYIHEDIVGFVLKILKRALQGEAGQDINGNVESEAIEESKEVAKSNVREARQLILPIAKFDAKILLKMNLFMKDVLQDIKDNKVKKESMPKIDSQEELKIFKVKIEPDNRLLQHSEQNLFADLVRMRTDMESEQIQVRMIKNSIDSQVVSVQEMHTRFLQLFDEKKR